MMNKLVLLLAAIMLIVTHAFAEEQTLEFVLFDGEASVPGAWQMATGVNTTNAYGDFDPYLITKDSCFVVEYTGTPDAVYLALSE